MNPYGVEADLKKFKQRLDLDKTPVTEPKCIESDLEKTPVMEPERKKLLSEAGPKKLKRKLEMDKTQGPHLDPGHIPSTSTTPVKCRPASINI